MNRSFVIGQNVNIILQSVGFVVGGNQQIILVLLLFFSFIFLGFQFSVQFWWFEYGFLLYIQVMFFLFQQVQIQSFMQSSPGPGQVLQNVCVGAPGPGLGFCSSSFIGGFVDVSVLVRQISLSFFSGGYFVFQDGLGFIQIVQGVQVQFQYLGMFIIV